MNKCKHISIIFCVYLRSKESKAKKLDKLQKEEGDVDDDVDVEVVEKKREFSKNLSRNLNHNDYNRL